MDDDELRHLFLGYGWKPRFVEGDDLDASLAAALDESYADIRTIQADARAGRPPERPQWPVIIVTSPKGWTGIKELDGVPDRGNVAGPPGAGRRLRDQPGAPRRGRGMAAFLRGRRAARTRRRAGSQRSSRFARRASGGWGATRTRSVAACACRCGYRRSRTSRSRCAVGARWPRARSETTGEYLARVVSANAAQRNFRIVCPDELDSNKLGAVLDVTTRAYEWPLRPVDVGHGRDGRVLEMLSEHNCQGWLEGYILTGRHGLFPSYEAFVEIVTGMANQLAKFLKVARELPWRPAGLVVQLPADVGGLAPGAQWLLAPGPGLHQRHAQQEGVRQPRLPAAGRQHAARGDGALPHVHQLDQPDRRVEAAAAPVADDGRGAPPLRGRRVGMVRGRARPTPASPTSCSRRPARSPRSRRSPPCSCSATTSPPSRPDS